MAYGTASAANWTGGNAGFEVDYVGTDSGGVESYNVISDNDGYGPQVLRVLRPTHPTPGVAHNFLYVLPVEAALGDTFGDGLETLAAEDAEDQYNLTIIEPSFTAVVRQQPRRPPFAVRHIHDVGARSLGYGKFCHQRNGAELVDRVLQVGTRWARSDPETPRYLL